MERKKRVVVIDDEEDLCALVKEVLEDEGSFEVTAVTEAHKAEALCAQLHPDLILLDVVMPDKNGAEIAKSLKKKEATKDIPIIIMSGLGEMVYFKQKQKWSWLPNRPIVKQRGEVIQESTAERAAEAYGVEDYISKPFEPDLLIEVIGEVLKKRGAS